MSQATPQAQIKSFRAPGAFLKGAIDARDLDVREPNIVEANDGVSTLVFEDEPHVGIRYLQNCCAFPVKYAINQPVTADSFHGILAACDATDDGLGSPVDLTRFRGAIYAMATGGAMRVATVIAYTPEKSPL